jgi:hypothetical protein
MSESTFNENMKRGAIPQPIQLPTGGLWWDREDIDERMASMKRVATAANDGVRDARAAQIEGRRAAS